MEWIILLHRPWLSERNGWVVEPRLTGRAGKENTICDRKSRTSQDWTPRTWGDIMKPGRNYMAARFCLPPTFYLSFSLGGIFKLLINHWQIWRIELFQIVQIFSFFFFFQAQVRLVGKQLCLPTKGEKTSTSLPQKGKHHQSSKQHPSLSQPRCF